MHEPPPGLSHDELLKQRADIQRGLSRVNTALLAIVIVVIALALACIVAAFGARERAAEAREATSRAREDLWNSYLAQATALRLSAVMGRKVAGEEIVAAAARIRPSLELRSEAIAQMAVTDLKDGHQEGLPDGDAWFALNPQQTGYAAYTRGGPVEYRSLPEHRLLFAWQSTNRVLSGAAFSPDGRFLGLSSPDKGFQVLDVQARAPCFCGPFFSAFDFSRDGTVLAGVTKDGAVHFFSSASGQETQPPVMLGQSVNDVAFDMTGRKLALNMGRTIEVRDWQNGGSGERFEHDNSIVVMAWSEHFLAVGDAVGKIEVWDLRSRKSNRWRAHKELVDNLFFNHHGDLLVSDSFDGSCKLWNPATGNLITATTKGFGSAFSPDDERLAYQTKSSRSSAWGWWELSLPHGFKTLDCSDGSDSTVWHADFSPDGRLLAVMKSDGLRLFEFPAAQTLAAIPMRRGRAAYFLPDGKRLLTCGDDRLAIWPVENAPGGNSVQLGKPDLVSLPKTGHVDTALMSLDRQKIALPLTDTEAVSIDLRDPTHALLLAGGDHPKEPAISPDGKWVVTGTFHGRGASIWDGSSGKKVIDLDDGNSNPVFSPDGAMVVLAGDRDYRVLESGSWKVLRRIPSGSVSDLPGHAAFSRDGRLLAIVKERHLLELLEPKSGIVLATLAAPDLEIINHLSFSWDGSWLAAATGNALQLWDLPGIRHQLACLGLDWSDSEHGRESTEVPVSVAGLLDWYRGSTPAIAPATAAVALVIFCSWFVLRRQRSLFASFVQIDELVELRNRELKVAQTELMHSQKMKALGTLAAGIAHDFNNLLSVIRMSNKLIGRDKTANPEIQENVAEVEKAVQQGKHIVASMLGSSTENGQANGCVSLPDLIEDTVGLLSRQFLSGITLDLELDRECPAVPLAQAHLEQILLNLVVNASESMAGRGRLRIQVRACREPGPCGVRAPHRADSYIELLVEDTGCGMSPEVLSRIFDPSFTTKVRGTGRGTGLGLSMVYTLAEQDGLGIGVETSPGKGTAFRMVIPLESSKPAIGAVAPTH